MKYLLLILGLLFLASCKKGEDDPFFSLLSRKQRLKGEWTLYKGTGDRAYDYVNETQSLSFTENYNYTGFTNYVNYNSALSSFSYEEDTYEYFSFYAKDSLTHTIRRMETDPLSGNVFEREIIQIGSWTWASGSGKGKSHLLASYGFVRNWTKLNGVKDSTETNYAADKAPSQLIKINRLSNKEFNIEFEYDSAGVNSTDLFSWKQYFLKD